MTHHGVHVQNAIDWCQYIDKETDRYSGGHVIRQGVVGIFRMRICRVEVTALFGYKR